MYWRGRVGQPLRTVPQEIHGLVVGPGVEPRDGHHAPEVAVVRARRQGEGERAGRLLELTGVEARDAQGVLDLGKIRVDAGRGLEQVGRAIEVPILGLHHTQVHVGAGERRRDLASERGLLGRARGWIGRLAPVVLREGQGPQRPSRVDRHRRRASQGLPRLGQAFVGLLDCPKQEPCLEEHVAILAFGALGFALTQARLGGGNRGPQGRGRVRSGGRGERSGDQTREGQASQHARDSIPRPIVSSAVLRPPAPPHALTPLPISSLPSLDRRRGRSHHEKNA